ncbi:MAG: hypothetical protein JSW25_07065 [Thermoplasmata archaeon]|nr:MAG: hypothetical protein JSW25_07065 [Thermoplasmata archaeon]
MVRGKLAFVAMLCLVAIAIILSGSAAGSENGIDGVIDEDEYPLSAKLGDGHFLMFWDISNGSIKMGLQAETSGMVAIGIEPTNRMLDADMIIAYRDGSTFSVHDAYSFGEVGPHPDDTDEGGSFDLNEYFVDEVGGVTTFEFIRLLETGDDLDNVIPTEGKVKFIWATSNSDDFNDYHARRGTAVIDVETGKFESVEYPTLWPYHAIFMSLAMIFFAATWFSVVYKKRFGKKFLMTHHSLGSLGVLFAIIGLGIGIYMVAQLESGHIRVGHSMVAVADLALGIAALAVGQVFMSRKDLKKKTRKPHIWLGGLSIVLMALVVLLGVVYVYPV